MSNNDLPYDAINWTAKQWIDYLSKDGVMNLEEFEEFNIQIINQLFGNITDDNKTALMDNAYEKNTRYNQSN